MSNTENNNSNQRENTERLIAAIDNLNSTIKKSFNGVNNLNNASTSNKGKQSDTNKEDKANEPNQPTGSSDKQDKASEPNQPTGSSNTSGQNQPADNATEQDRRNRTNLDSLIYLILPAGFLYLLGNLAYAMYKDKVPFSNLGNITKGISWIMGFPIALTCVSINNKCKGRELFHGLPTAGKFLAYPIALTLGLPAIPVWALIDVCKGKVPFKTEYDSLKSSISAVKHWCEEFILGGQDPNQELQMDLVPDDDNTNPELSHDNTNPELSYDNTNPELSHDNTNPELSYDNTNPELSHDNTGAGQSHDNVDRSNSREKVSNIEKAASSKGKTAFGL